MKLKSAEDIKSSLKSKSGGSGLVIDLATAIVSLISGLTVAGHGYAAPGLLPESVREIFYE
jgi:hypothetical protein